MLHFCSEKSDKISSASMRYPVVNGRRLLWTCITHSWRFVWQILNVKKSTQNKKINYYFNSFFLNTSASKRLQLSFNFRVALDNLVNSKAFVSGLCQYLFTIFELQSKKMTLNDVFQLTIVSFHVDTKSQAVEDKCFNSKNLHVHWSVRH